MLIVYSGVDGKRSSSGHNAITGSTVVAGSPDTSATARRVQIFTDPTRPYLIAQTWSDDDGGYAFERIRHRTASDGYTVIAYDHTGVHDPVAKANVIPTPMPPDPAEHP